MREIKFRGISIEDGQFEYGDLITSFGETFIGNTDGNHPENWCEVIPETVGQFTGLTDKNGVEIYEGDVLKVFILREDQKQEEGVLKIVWDDFAFCLESISGNIGYCWLSVLSENIVGQISEYEIIGNIHQKES